MERLDTLLLKRGLVPSRSWARRLVLEGKIEGHRGQGWLTLRKPGQKMPADTRLRLTDTAALRYVSRGGMKLHGALLESGMPVAEHTVLDVGQSTGGFSDCLLQAGVASVVGIDSGRHQLAPSLRGNPRLSCIEGVNARHLPDALPAALIPRHGFKRIVMDVSFISQTLILPHLIALMDSDAQILALVKPQFEVGRKNVGKGGIVRDPRHYEEVRSTLIAHYRDQGLATLAYFESPIQGGDGNREFFIYASRLS